jgi:hypothetical protein
VPTMAIRPTDKLYLPRIAPEDFESFRQLMKDQIPPTYQEWLEAQRERVAMHGSNFVIVEVKVNVDQFARFCDAKPGAKNYGALLDFTRAIAKVNNQVLGKFSVPHTFGDLYRALDRP